MLQSINPYTNKVIEKFEEFSEKKVESTISMSANSFKTWRFVSFTERAKFMNKAADILLDRKEKYANTITEEMGKPITESIAEIEKCAWVCKYYAEYAEEHLKSEIIKTEATSSYVNFEPLGTILGIMPWNFPFWQVFRFIVPTIMAGNTALLKHASNVQRCALQIEEVMHDAGFPKGVFSSLIIGSSKIIHVIKNKHIKGISLTGSEYAGSMVAQEAGLNIKKTVLELGGTNAFIVLEDADIDLAVNIGIKARFMNCGQSCIAAKRFIVHESIFEQFVANFTDAASKLVIGDPMDKKTILGPLATTNQTDIIEKQVNQSIKLGAEPHLQPKRDINFYYPLILTNVNTNMPVFKEEVFGPVAPVIAYKNENEAIELSNMSPYGLGVSIITSDIENVKNIVPYFEDGAVFINELVKSDPRLPFGGTKKSGYGRELSFLGIREFVNAKTVYIKD